VNNPAFPELHPSDESRKWFLSPGMTLRDYFAAQILPVSVEYWAERHGGFKDAAQEAYEIADAMLKAREDTNQ